MTRGSRNRPSGWRLPAAWSTALLVLIGFSGTALAAGEGETCGRIGPWRERCDEGLRCEIERRSRLFAIGVCERPSCGGLLGETCPEGQFCDFAPDAGCGFADQTGVCKPRPEICTREFFPVCGCDGRTYSNACTAHAAGASIEREGACEWCESDADCPHGRCESRPTCAGLDCPPSPPPTCTVCGDGSTLICLALPAPCPDGQVREIVEGCYGECVDPATCAAVSGSCDDDDPNRSYVETDPETCATIRFLCAPGWVPFFDSCGCGCEVA